MGTESFCNSLKRKKCLPFCIKIALTKGNFMFRIRWISHWGIFKSGFNYCIFKNLIASFWSVILPTDWTDTGRKWLSPQLQMWTGGDLTIIQPLSHSQSRHPIHPSAAPVKENSHGRHNFPLFFHLPVHLAPCQPNPPWAPRTGYPWQPGYESVCLCHSWERHRGCCWEALPTWPKWLQNTEEEEEEMNGAWVVWSCFIEVEERWGLQACGGKMLSSLVLNLGIWWRYKTWNITGFALEEVSQLSINRFINTHFKWMTKRQFWTQSFLLLLELKYRELCLWYHYRALHHYCVNYSSVKLNEIKLLHCPQPQWVLLWSR